MRPRGERGSASVLVVAAAAAALLALVGMVGALRISTEAIRAGTVADAAALGAAAAAVGLVPGPPCNAARRAVSAAGMTIDSCTVDHAVATVRVRAGDGAFAVGATARAGPPGIVRYI